MRALNASAEIFWAIGNALPEIAFLKDGRKKFVQKSTTKMNRQNAIFLMRLSTDAY
jgi:hypothetical protein